jgi:hypothetical protein
MRKPGIFFRLGVKRKSSESEDWSPANLFRFVSRLLETSKFFGRGAGRKVFILFLCDTHLRLRLETMRYLVNRISGGLFLSAIFKTCHYVKLAVEGEGIHSCSLALGSTDFGTIHWIIHVSLIRVAP